jgi:cytosine/adenosine deaminase-related metal-dependent hydrolase
LDTFAEMLLAEGIARVQHRDDPLPARDVVALATCDGAAALGLGAEVGSLETGKRADIAVVDVAQVHHAPFAARDPYTTLVHAARATDVRLTMVDGRVLYANGRHAGLDPGRIVAEATREAQALLARASFA